MRETINKSFQVEERDEKYNIPNDNPNNKFHNVLRCPKNHVQENNIDEILPAFSAASLSPPIVDIA